MTITELAPDWGQLTTDAPGEARQLASLPSTLIMRDTSNPQGHDLRAQVAAGYLGGGTPHVWTWPDWKAQSARWALPIWVPDNPNTGQAEAASYVEQLHRWAWPTGVAVGWDMETNKWAGEVAAAAAVLAVAGYHILPYGSAFTLFANPGPYGYWVAHWTYQPHLYPHAGVVATQYTDRGVTADGVAFDESLILGTVPLYERHPPAPVPTNAVLLSTAKQHLANAMATLDKIKL